MGGIAKWELKENGGGRKKKRGEEAAGPRIWIVKRSVRIKHLPPGKEKEWEGARGVDFERINGGGNVRNVGCGGVKVLGEIRTDPRRKCQPNRGRAKG